MASAADNTIYGALTRTHQAAALARAADQPEDDGDDLAPVPAQSYEALGPKKRRLAPEAVPADPALSTFRWLKPKAKWHAKGSDEVITVKSNVKNVDGSFDRFLSFTPACSEPQQRFRGSEEVKTAMSSLHEILKQAQLQAGPCVLEQAEFDVLVGIALTEHVSPHYARIGAPQIPPAITVREPHQMCLRTSLGTREVTYQKDAYEHVDITPELFRQLYGDSMPGNFDEMLETEDKEYLAMVYQVHSAWFEAVASTPEKSPLSPLFAAAFQHALDSRTRQEVLESLQQRIKLIYVDEKEDERRLFLHFYDEGRRVDERAYAWYGKSDEPAELELEKLKAFESFVDYAKGLLADEQIDWFELIEKLSHKSGWQHYEYRHKGTTLGKAGNLSLLEVVLYQCLKNATTGGPPHIHGRGRTAYTSEYPKLLEGLGKHIARDAATGEEIIRDAYTGEVLVRAPHTEDDRSKRDEYILKGLDAITVDHIYQQVLGLRDGEVVNLMNEPTNLAPTSPHVNNLKHRYGLAILALLLLGVVLSRQDPLEPGFVHVASRLVRLARRIYMLHCIPCDVLERNNLPLVMLIFARKMDELMWQELGANFYMPPPPLDAAFEDLDDADLDDLAQKQVQELRAIYAERTSGRQLDLSSEFPVRPGRDLKKPVPSDQLDLLRSLSDRLNHEFSQSFGISFPLTEDGFIALSVDANENGPDVFRALRKFGSGLDPDGSGAFTTPISPFLLYASALCVVATYYVERNAGEKFEPAKKVPFIDPIFPGLSLMIPYDSKGAFSPSIARNDHSVPHSFGFSKNADITMLSMQNFDKKSCNFRLSTWAANSAEGSGGAEAVAHSREAVISSARFWLDGVGEGSSWIIEDTSLEADERVQALEELAEVMYLEMPDVAAASV